MAVFFVRLAKVMLVLFTLLLILVVLGAGSIWSLQVVFHAAAGSFIHARDNLPAFLEKWPGAIPPLLCLILACVFGHRFIRWWVTAAGDRIPWRPVHTATIFSLLLLGSAAAIALSGVVHQGVWLFSSPWTERNYTRALMEARNNARYIYFAALEHEVNHGRFPDTFPTEEEENESIGNWRSLLWMEPADGTPKEPFVLLRPGKEEIGVTLPLVVSPMIPRGNFFVVAYTDGEVRTLKSEVWERERARLLDYD